ncbi:MAG: DUF438 domain-containing protein [Anaerococcus sp.]|nr:DUF438 domain-containing protein [Anaerococcus sp.]
MSKKIDINKPLGPLLREDPSLKDDLISIGFKALANPIMVKTMADKMSIKRGAKLMAIKDVSEKLKDLGYDVIDSSNDEDVSRRRSLIKSYVQRLSQGEDMEAVKKDFRDNFKDVSSSEIMDAEEALLDEGLSKKDVRRLCDVHSTLFHGCTETETQRNLKLVDIKGHPLRFFNLENEKIKEILKEAKGKLQEGVDDPKAFDDLFKIGSHYKKKGDLIYPVLKEKYGKKGPSDVMWGVDIEIANGFRRNLRLAKMDQLEAVIKRAEEMTYKEENILFPLMEDTLGPNDYKLMREDLLDYDHILVDLENTNVGKKDIIESGEGFVSFNRGKLSLDQIRAIFDTLEIEITFVDENDINTYYNEGREKNIFKRPKSSLGRDVYSCHPPDVEPLVRRLISDFKEGKRDDFKVTRNIGGRDYSIAYLAVRDKDDKYMGVLECVSDISSYREYFSR